MGPVLTGAMVGYFVECFESRLAPGEPVPSETQPVGTVQ